MNYLKKTNKKKQLNFPAVWFTYIIFICAVGAVSKIKCLKMSKIETTVTRDVLFSPLHDY